MKFFCSFFLIFPIFFDRFVRFDSRNIDRQNDAAINLGADEDDRMGAIVKLQQQMIDNEDKCNIGERSVCIST